MAERVRDAPACYDRRVSAVGPKIVSVLRALGLLVATWALLGLIGWIAGAIPPEDAAGVTGGDEGADGEEALAARDAGAPAAPTDAGPAHAEAARVRPRSVCEGPNGSRARLCSVFGQAEGTQKHESPKPPRSRAEIFV